MITRNLSQKLVEDARKVPSIGVFGPRQSGKTTLVRATFPQHTYISLENYDMRDFAQSDPRGFLNTYKNEHGIILDEVQHVPTILSYIQTEIDLDYKPGYYVLTGSQNILAMQAVSQSLAGRISLHTLLPFSIDELSRADLLADSPEAMIFRGFYPRIYDQRYNPADFYADYVKTYVERDVRMITQVSDLTVFRNFIRLCAGRIGQLVNFTSLGNECGISYNTAKAWISLLEASYILFLQQSYHTSFNKRLIKSPKIMFYDPGLACHLLGIESEKQLSTHYLRGGLFESMIISDFHKASYNADRTPRIYFWRDHSGNEIDCIIERGHQVFPIEIKASQTIHADFFKTLLSWNELSHAQPQDSFLVYGGDDNQERSAGTVVSWKKLSAIQDHCEKRIRE